MLEKIACVGPDVIVVANGDNHPFSVGRGKGRADDSEFSLLDVADFLNAGQATLRSRKPPRGAGALSCQWTPFASSAAMPFRAASCAA